MYIYRREGFQLKQKIYDNKLFWPSFKKNIDFQYYCSHSFKSANNSAKSLTVLSWFALISDQMSLVHYPLTGALMIGPDYFVTLTSLPLVHQMVK